jgi:hypothetical protein
MRRLLVLVAATDHCDQCAMLEFHCTPLNNSTSPDPRCVLFKTELRKAGDGALRCGECVRSENLARENQ